MLLLENVSKSFGRTEVIRPLNYSFRHGIYGLLGPNGAGKTTLIHMIAAASSPTSGKITFNGKDIFREGDEYYHSLGFLPQQEAIYPSFKAYDYLDYMARLKGIAKANIKSRIEELASLCNLERELGKRCGNYSGGMKRRLGLMQALLNDPDVLILDEPTSGLDPLERVRLRNLISELAQNRTVILSTHIVPDVEYIANQIIFLKEGHFACEGTPQDLRQRLERRVWEKIIPSGELEAMSQSYQIISVKSMDSGKLRVRYLTKQHLEDATPISPSLEDVFVSVFNIPLAHRTGDEVFSELPC